MKTKFDNLRSRKSFLNARQVAIEKAQGRCQICQYLPPFGMIQVHHIVKIKENPTLNGDVNNLICVCPKCHHKLDKGKFYNDEGLPISSAEWVRNRFGLKR